jgi:hypothetical protein
VCGRDPDFIVQGGGSCDVCAGSGEVSLSLAQAWCGDEMEIEYVKGSDQC